MIVRYCGVREALLSTEEKTFFSRKETAVSDGTLYRVHAISVYQNVLFVLIVDDDRQPCFVPCGLVETVDPSVDADWQCGVFCEHGISLVLGPRFLSESVEAYTRMVDRDPLAWDSFWARFWRVESDLG